MKPLSFALAVCMLTATACQQQGFDTANLDNAPEAHSSSDAVLSVTDENFQTEVLDSSSLVLVDFWAPWCVPCRKQGPIVDGIAEEMQAELKVVKVDTDESKEFAEKYGVTGLPTLIFFKNGQPVEQFVGMQNRKTLLDAIAKLKNERI